MDLNLPNKHLINFANHFNMIGTHLEHPFFVIPCKYDTEKKEVVFHPDYYSVFNNNISYLNNPICSVLSKKDITLSNLKHTDDNYNSIDFLLKSSSKSFGFNDISIGYYDNIKKEYNQLGYIEKYCHSSMSSIIDYAYTLSLKHFYESDKFLNLRIKNSISQLQGMMSFKFTEKQIYNFLFELKQSVIEASFLSKEYENDFFGMNEEITFKLEKFFFDTVGEYLYEEEFVFTSYLKIMGVLDFYLYVENENTLYPMDFIPENKMNEENEVIYCFSKPFIEIVNSLI